MFQLTKTKLLAVLAAAVASGLGGAGCQSDLGPVAPYGVGTTYAVGSTWPNPAGPGGGPVPAVGPGPGAKTPGPQYLPNVQQTAYAGEDANGKPIQVPIAPPGGPGPDMGPGPIPTEINLVSHPPYTVAPPDILYIDAARLVPKPPYYIEPLDALVIQATQTLPNEPINSTFIVTPEGTISLGYGYGTVRVQGLTIEQIQAAIRLHLSNVLRNPQVSVSLAQFRAQMQVRGEHLVRPDGTITLGAYGSVYVAGMTLGQVKCVIEKHLSQYVNNPQVAVDVYAYNSKSYYVVFDGGGYGQQIFRLPVTGNETVLDAISNLQGLPPVSSQWRIWVARPAPCGNPCDQILMVDWEAVVKGGSTCTNYQLFPGDRVYVDADCLIKTSNWIAKVFDPIERVLGITLLGASVRNTFRSNGTVIVP
jgi:polysaccharide export outer membrane protein